MASKDLVEALEPWRDELVPLLETALGTEPCDTVIETCDWCTSVYRHTVDVLTRMRSEMETTLANHRECDALEALEALMDCNRGSIPDEVWAKAREVVEAAT